MKLYFREKGEGYPLVILHGLWGASDNWLTIANRLADRYRVILPDLRNHGQSPHSGIHDYHAMSEDILELINDLNLEKPFIIGHSMGGKTLMALLLKNPEAIRKAVVVDIAPVDYSKKNNMEHIRLLNFTLFANLGKIKTREDLTAFIKFHFPEPYLHQLLFKNIHKTENCFEWKVNTTAIRNNISDLLGWDVTALHPVCNTNILFIKGELSSYIRSEYKAIIRNVFPAANFTTINNATHWLHVEQPDTVTEIIRQFCIYI